MPVAKDAAQQLQATGFLRKPVRLEELLSAVDRVFQGLSGRNKLPAGQHYSG